MDDSSADVVLSLSTIEHLPPEDRAEFAEHANRILRPGGYVVLTVDLFLDLYPFTDRERNQYGTNVNVAQLLEAVGAEIVVGDHSQILGFPEFAPRAVQAQLEDFAIGEGHPAMAQCVVARVG